MVSQASVDEQLKRINFKQHGWGRTEIRELPNILLPDEEIYECVNGIYEGGFALLVATNVRVLLIDKKPLKYLTVEDLRFDMITELDYNHRLFGAHIRLSAGSRNLKFTSVNQPNLRKLIGHIQHCMAEAKQQQSSHQSGQKQHLEQINRQLQTYLVAQHKQQQELQEQLKQNASSQPVQVVMPPDPIRPERELNDYLYAQGLLSRYQADTGTLLPIPEPSEAPIFTQLQQQKQAVTEQQSNPQMADLYAEGMQEIFGKKQDSQTSSAVVVADNVLEINALKIAYSKLPMALRNRRFGRPLFHSHSQELPITPEVVPEI